MTNAVHILPTSSHQVIKKLVTIERWHRCAIPISHIVIYVKIPSQIYYTVSSICLHRANINCTQTLQTLDFYYDILLIFGIAVKFESDLDHFIIIVLDTLCEFVLCI